MGENPTEGGRGVLSFDNHYLVFTLLKLVL
jgi:hypothetical protein